MQDPNWHDLKSQSLLLNMSSIRTVIQLMIRRITFFAMSHSNQLEEPTFPRLMHCCRLIYMCGIAVRAGDSRRGHGGLRWMKHKRCTWKITVQLTRLIRCSWDGIWLIGHGGGGMHPPGMQKQLQWVWHILCTVNVPKVLWIQNGRSLLYQDQGFGRGCLFRWYSTNVQIYIPQGMKRCAWRILRWKGRSVEQAKLVLLNVTIISKESPICNTLMKKNTRSKKDEAMRWKYDAIEATFE